MPDAKLVAWIEPQGNDEFLAAFVAATTARQRAPATQRCSSPGEASQWVEQEAASLDVRVEWVSGPLRSA